MAEVLPLGHFKKIYVVDLCPSLCKYARAKVAEKGWKNVEVVEGDAASWAPPGGQAADLVTFSYSLSSAFVRIVADRRGSSLRLLPAAPPR